MQQGTAMYSVQSCIVQEYSLPSVHHCTALQCTVLKSNVLWCTAMHCTKLHCTALDCTASHCTGMHCTALQYTVVKCCIACSSAWLWITKWLFSWQVQTPQWTAETLATRSFNCTALHKGVETWKSWKHSCSQFGTSTKNNSKHWGIKFYLKLVLFCI